MKIKAALIGIIIILVAVICLVTCKNKSNKTSNTSAENDKKNRYVTIINDTGTTINKAGIIVGEGTEIEETEVINPDDKSFSIKIPKEYIDEDTFTIYLQDNYDVIYKKKIYGLPKTGRTEVYISKEDKDDSTDSFWNTIIRFFNGD